jgi:A/G-specific adenine glycosylase
MLQQTQVATVIPYYNRWMAKYVPILSPLDRLVNSSRFLTIKDLAASDIETVNSLWKGLGYYSRAARLLNGAQKTVKELQGRLPDNAKDMETKIPGVGRYSAGAICSIAYNHCVPVVGV